MSAKAEVLNERAAILLKRLVYSYISDGQPVGSKRLAHDAGLDISSATIRNVLSVLEKKGLVKAPHTSAGRIPTERGFRMFVDSLLEVQPIQKQLLNRLKKELNPDQDTDTHRQAVWHVHLVGTQQRRVRPTQRAGGNGRILGSEVRRGRKDG